MSGSTSKRYPVELRGRAARMVGEIQPDHEAGWAAMTQVATLLGVGTQETIDHRHAATARIAADARAF
jgi:transposase